jgi:hypothetical protein
MQRLAAIPRAGHRIALPEGWDHGRAHATLAALLAEAAPEAAGLFAVPEPGADAIGFFAPPGRIAAHAELDAEGRAALRAELGRLASVLRRAAAARAHRDPARDGALPALVAAAIEVPSFEVVFAHSPDGQPGRPVLAGWGMVPAGAIAGLGLIARLDDGASMEVPARAPVSALALAALALVLLAGGVALASPWIAAALAPPAPVCRPASGSVDAMQGLLREQLREQELRRQLAELERERGIRRASCPLPAPPAPPSPPPALPQERWDRGDLSMLDGCWNRRTNMVLQDIHTGERITATRWTMCFDQQGQGSQTIVMSDGRQCTQPLRARFEGGQIRIDEIGRCNFSGRQGQTFNSRFECTRLDENRANCVRIEREGPRPSRADGLFAR